MHWLRTISLVSVVSATFNPQRLRPSFPRDTPSREKRLEGQRLYKRQQSGPKFLNANTTRFAVNGSAIPDVPFDVGESYAGLLPIGGPNDTNQLYFWFFPSTNPASEKEILIWLTGGVVWVDQPVGSGFSIGQVTATDENDVARQFMGFWKNFVNTFSMQGYKVYVTGSSYSGVYTPYVASAMLDANDRDYFNVSGMQIFDGEYAKDILAQQIPVHAFVEYWSRVLAFNDSFVTDLRARAQSCGYADYLQKYLVFPPAGVQPASLPSEQADGRAGDGCDLFNAVYSAALELNPCFSVYSIFNRCPLTYDPLGFTDAFQYVPEGSGPVYLNRPDVKKAINAPNKEWKFCADDPVFVNNTDNSILAGPASQPVIPNVIDRTGNVIIGHGSQDFVLFADGALLAIQNMTWGGRLGFQARPSTPLFVPYHGDDPVTSLAGAGVVGTMHSERGLTYFGVAQAGHFLAQDQPALAYRSVEMLLGRVDSLGSLKPFTTDTNATTQPSQVVGNGTFAGIGASGGDSSAGGAAPVKSSGMARGVGNTFWVVLCAALMTTFNVLV